LLLPDEGTGIKRKVLNSLRSDRGRRRSEAHFYIRELQRIVFQRSDVSFFYLSGVYM
jgi:hypothetical protein